MAAVKKENAETIRVLVVEPMKEPELRVVPHTLRAMQEIVGGTLQAVYPWPEYAALVCDDEAKLKRSQPNRMLGDYDIVCGTFFVCGLSRDNFADLPDDLVEKFRGMFRYPEMFARTLSGKLLRFRIGSGEPPKEVFRTS